MARECLIHGRHGLRSSGPQGVNPLLVRLSTLLFDNLAHMRDARAWRDQEQVLSSGARGNSTAFAPDDLITDLEGGHSTKPFATANAAAAQCADHGWRERPAR